MAHEFSCMSRERASESHLSESWNRRVGSSSCTIELDSHEFSVAHSVRSTPARSAMERPTRVLFGYEEVERGRETTSAGGAVCRDEGGVRAWNGFVPGICEQLDLESGLGALAGVSGGLSTIVPRLLLPDLRGRSMLPQASVARVIHVEPVDGRPCYGLEAPPRQPGGRRLLGVDAASRRWNEGILLASLAKPGLTKRDRGILDRSLDWTARKPRRISCTFVPPPWAPDPTGPARIGRLP